MKCRWFLESQQGFQILGCKERKAISPFTQLLALLGIAESQTGKENTLKNVNAAQKSSLAHSFCYVECTLGRILAGFTPQSVRSNLCDALILQMEKPRSGTSMTRWSPVA